MKKQETKPSTEIYQVIFENLSINSEPGNLSSNGRKLLSLPLLGKKEDHVKVSYSWEDIGHDHDIWCANLVIGVDKLSENPRVQLENIFFSVNREFRKLSVEAYGSNMGNVYLNYVSPIDRWNEPVGLPSIYKKVVIPSTEKVLKVKVDQLWDSFSRLLSSYETNLEGYIVREQEQLDRLRKIRRQIICVG